MKRLILCSLLTCLAGSWGSAQESPFQGSPKWNVGGQLVRSDAPPAALPATPQATAAPAIAPATPAYGSCNTLCEPTSCCKKCGPEGRFWVSAEWLFWATSGEHVPALIAISAPGTARSLTGVPTTPATTVLYGDKDYNNDFRSGFRFNAGMWLNCAQTCGIETDFFYLGQGKSSYSAGSPDGSNQVGRPYIDATTGLPSSELVSFPGVLSGFVTANLTTDAIGGGFNFICNQCCSSCDCCNSGRTYRVDSLYGFRFFNLRDTLTIDENLTSLGGTAGVPAGGQFLIEDRFHTSNQFYGGAIGASAYWQQGRLFVQARGSVAIGVNHETVDISGTTTIIQPSGASAVYPGGLLTQPTNIGSYSSDQFAAMPEASLRVGALVTPRLRAFVGYNVMYLSNVVRAAEQVNLNVNTSQLAPGTLAGVAQPSFTFVRTDFWAQGISVGAEFRW